jgi:DNA-binding GntR family transcriptional regulator
LVAKTPHLPNFEARRPVSDLEHVYNELKQSFMIGEFAPGHKLTLLPLHLHVEGKATRLAVQAGCEAIAPELERINAEMYAKVPQEDMKSYLRLNQRFHFLIYKQSGNEDLVDPIELLWMRYGPIMNIVRSGVLSTSGRVRHAEVIDTIRKGSVDKATAAIRADILEAAGPISEAIASRAKR